MKKTSNDCDISKGDSAQTQCESETEISGDSHQRNDVDGDNASNEVDDAWGLAHDSCLQPVDIRVEIMAELENHILSVAPAEKNKPHSLLNTPNDEMKAFPTLFPHGVNGFDEKRDKIVKSKVLQCPTARCRFKICKTFRVYILCPSLGGTGTYYIRHEHTIPERNSDNRWKKNYSVDDM